MNKKGFALVPAVLIVSVISVFIFVIFRNREGLINEPLLTTVSNTITGASPTPFLFEEMTIPYLRGREYKSTLGKLERYSTGSNYTSYLTSYDSDGLKINGLLTVPGGEEPAGGWPAIVFVHGYIAPTIYETTTRYVDYVNYLARNGFVVFKIDLRGHGDSEGEAGGGYYSEGYVVDTLNAYSALQSSEFVNSKKIGLWGHSMAGNILLRSLAARPEIPAAVVWAGAGFTYSDLQDYRISDNSYRPPMQNTERARKRQLLRDTYGEFDPNSDFWKKVAPSNYLKDLKGAIELHHAVDDSVVSVEYSRNLNKLLDETQVEHSLFEYPSGGHNLEGSSFSQAMSRAVDFFKLNL